MSKKVHGLSFMREQALKRDNYNCQIKKFFPERNCWNKKNRKLDVHHIDETGSNRPAKEQNNNLDNLITLCHFHHMNLHQSGKNVNKGKWQEDKERDKKIFELSKEKSQTEISKMYDISRQRVHQIVKKYTKINEG